MLVSHDGTIDGLSIYVSMCKVHPCGICGFKVVTHSVLCVRCSKCIYGRYSRLLMVTAVC